MIRKFAERRKSVSFAAVLVLFCALAGCASPKPLQLTGDEAFAAIYTPPVECIARGACVARVSIQAINGETVSNFSTKYNYKVSPGPVSVIVILFPVGGDGVKGDAQGLCELKWLAVSGEVYTLDRVAQADGFQVTATTRDGAEATSCYAPFS